MKKSMLCAGLVTMLSASAYAEPQVATASDTVVSPTTSDGIKTPSSGTTVLPNDPGVKTPTVVAPTTGTTTTTTTGTTTPTTSTTTTTTGTTTPTMGVQQNSTIGTQAPAVLKPAQPFNCKYRIPAQTTRIEPSIVTKWAEKATLQSFDLDYKTIETQLADLKACYTEQGWQGFNDALQKSGNVNAIKAQQLMMSAMVTGESKVTEIKENQWKIAIPMQVVYQNEKEKLTQPLTVNLLIGRKVSGDLGIMQLIAIPRQGNTPVNTGGSTTAPVQ